MKIAVIGCGSIGRRHAKNLHSLGINDLLFVDPQEERSRSLAYEVSGCSFRTALEAYERGANVALICAPTSMHLPLAWEALENKCHIFVEKPISHSMKGVDAFIEASEAQRRVLLVGYNFRFDRIVEQVKEWLGAFRIGRVTSARFHFGSYLPWRHPWEDYRQGYGARRELGGGALLDAIHELDMVVWLFGHPARIYCLGGKYSDLEIDTEDNAEILMSYRDKAISIHLDYIEQPVQRSFEIIGTRGRIEADLFGRTARYFDGEKKIWVGCDDCGTIDETYQREMRHFIECVSGEAEPLVDGSAALESLFLADLGKESMSSGLPVLVGQALGATAR